MTAKLVALAAILGIVTVTASTPRFAEQSEAMRSRLQARAVAFYETLKGQHFDEAWSFFDAALRRDNPQAEYAKHLRNSQRGVEIVTPPKSTLAPDPRNADKPPVGRVVATLRIKGVDGKPVSVQHSTIWYWGALAVTNGPDWYIAREETRDIGGPTSASGNAR